MSDDLISRQAVLDYIDSMPSELTADGRRMIRRIRLTEYIQDSLPSAQPEPLTDKEQRIFLAAMGREKKVCKEVDAEMTREPYEDSLVKTCREIIRKVKGALWT